MKLHHWICGALLAGALASCSNNDAPAPDSPSQSETATGYLALSINLPQEILSRATDGTDDNVIFADGESWEYGVNDAKLFLFTTPDAATPGRSATFHSSYDLKRAFSPTDPSEDQISASSVEAVAVDIEYADDAEPYLWALVMLNVPANLTEPADGQTFSDYLKSTSELSFMKEVGGKKYIFMTNAPLSAKQGGAVSPTATPTIFTLASLGKASDAIKQNLQEARENVAGCVYVERALAKVTAKFDNVQVEIKGADAENPTSLGLTINTGESTFGLDHINKSSYIVKNVLNFPTTTNEKPFAWNMASTKTNYFRMVGNTGMPTFANHPLLHNEINPQLYRTYWCVDPNYDTALGANFDATAEENFAKIGSGAFYAKENTFTVENQNYGNTTMAVFKITFTLPEGATSLYTLNGNNEAVYTSEKDAASHIYEYLLAQDVVKQALEGSTKDGVTGTIPYDTYLKVTFDRDPKSGILTAKGITLDNDADDFDDNYGTMEAALAKFNAILTTVLKNDLLYRVNALYTIAEYTGGVSYYAIPIMHFGQASTPWAANGGDQTKTDEAYPGAEGLKYDSTSFLGRYGLVRNNWYELGITKFTGLGEPVKPDFTGDKTSDDNNEVKKYIGIETHILSWAKRTQSVGF